MKGFELVVPGRIVFGENKIDTLSKYILNFGTNILFLCGSNSLKASGTLDRIIDKFEENGIRYEIQTVLGEPEADTVDMLVNEYRQKEVDVVVSVGGGSTIDTGKAVSAMLAQEGSITDYLEGVGEKKPSGKKIPFIACPTTSGTGSECTKNAVIKGVKGKVRFKKSLRHDNYMPDVAIVDPVLTLGCPKNVTRNSGIDAFCQILEAYVCTNSNGFTDTLAYKGIRRIADNIVKVYNNPDDLEARSNVAYGSLLSGICMANAGLTTIHGFAGVIGGLFDGIPHGAVCASLLYGATVVNLQKIKDFEPNNPAGYKYARVGAYLMGATYYPDRHDIYFRAIVETLKDWQKKMDIKPLREYGITRDDFWEILDGAAQRYNPVKLTDSEMEKILEYSY